MNAAYHRQELFGIGSAAGWARWGRAVGTAEQLVEHFAAIRAAVLEYGHGHTFFQFTLEESVERSVKFIR